MDDKDVRQILKDEYFHIQGVIESFDVRAVTIKGWSITFSFAAVGAAFATHTAATLLLAALSAALFWIIEGFWKTFQYAYYDRSGKIEDYFAGKTQIIVPLQIGRNWYKRWKGGGVKRLWRILWWPHVALPHLAVAFLGAALFVLVELKILTI